VVSVEEAVVAFSLAAWLGAAANRPPIKASAITILETCADMRQQRRNEALFSVTIYSLKLGTSH
jgi:hypothetical protein